VVGALLEMTVVPAFRSIKQARSAAQHLQMTAKSGIFVRGNYLYFANNYVPYFTLDKTSSGLERRLGCRGTRDSVRGCSLEQCREFSLSQWSRSLQPVQKISACTAG
jgi:hypothetical protein